MPLGALRASPRSCILRRTAVHDKNVRRGAKQSQGRDAMRWFAAISKAGIWTCAATALAAATALLAGAGPAAAQEPIKIGFSVSLTGGLASSGKAHLLSKQIWAEEINAKGGLLGRPVRLVYYDD